MSELDQAQAQKVYKRSQEDPIFHVEEIQGCKTLEAYQKRIIKAITDHDRICIRSCHDLGKTFTLAKIVLWFSSSHKPSKLISTAPTFNQVKRLLWSEIRAGFRKSKMYLGGTMLTTEWKIHEDWFALGFTSRGESNAGEGQGTASGFQGFHSEYILIVFDEATGIPKTIWDQVEGMLTSANVKFIAIGNPTSRASEFFKCFKDPAWHKINLSCFDSPNLIANGFANLNTLEAEIALVKTLNDTEATLRLKSYKVVQPQLLSTSWVVAMGIKWGVSHPLFVSKVLGDFPEEDENIMISLATVENAQYRHEAMIKEKRNPSVRSIGIDPARFGADKTVVTVLEDNFQTLRKVLPKGPTTETVNFIINYFKTVEYVKRQVVVIDGTGIGAGVVDGLMQAKNQGLLPNNVIIEEVHFGAQCEDESDKEHFANLKAKLFHSLAESLRTDLAILPENVYLEELPLIIYGFTPKGQLIIESKDDYKKRTGLGSPDDSDSLGLANLGRMGFIGAGEFTEKHIPKSVQGATFSPSLNSGDNW